MLKRGDPREGRCDSWGNCSSLGLASPRSSLGTFRRLEDVRRGGEAGEAELGEVCSPRTAPPRTAWDISPALVWSCHTPGEPGALPLPSALCLAPQRPPVCSRPALGARLR